MAEAKDLLRLRRLQSQSAASKLAAAEARCRALEGEIAAALQSFEADQAAMENERKARIGAMIGNPSNPVTIARIGFQYEAEVDAKLARVRTIRALVEKLKSANADRDVARDERNERTKAERKIEELTKRLSAIQDQRQDAIMEEER